MADILTYDDEVSLDKNLFFSLEIVSVKVAR
jgi:hypothetical protein